MNALVKGSIALLLVAASLPAVVARADEAMAREFARRNAAVLKDFDPVGDALKADGLKGKELKREAARIKGQMGQPGQVAAPAAAARAPRAGRAAARPAMQQPALTTPERERMARAMRARANKAAVLQYYAQLNAYNEAAMNYNIMSAMNRSVGNFNYNYYRPRRGF